MNALVLGQTGGYPLTQERLAELQTAFSVMQGFGALVGSTAIISGCTVNGSQTTSGVVYYNNEVFNFIGGTTQADVVIVEETTERAFQDGTNKPVHKNRYITFGSGTGSIPWENFVRADTTKQLTEKSTDFENRLQLLEAKTAVFQQGGGMILWNKPAADIPAGYAEVVNWRGRLPIGLDTNQTEFNTVGKIGGSKTKNITTNNMPNHFHYVAANITTNGNTEVSSTNYVANFSLNTQETSGSTPSDNYDLIMAGTPTVANVGKSSSEGNGQAMDVLNPYRVVLFIEWVGL